MVQQLENLTIEERDLLYKAPVLLSVLAACSHDGVNNDQKTDAIKLAHLKTFTADPLLILFYTEAEKNFKTNFELTVADCTPFDEVKRSKLKEKISQVHIILRKLDKDYADKLSASFEKYEKHVKRAAHSVIQDFIFPMPIQGLNN